ncbi:MAG: hypothetical protein PHU28_02060, partial [Methanosarcinaceae archaeon]|nr:hypothetical protein [Methanosarcinaceae archaeon]
FRNRPPGRKLKIRFSRNIYAYRMNINLAFSALMVKFISKSLVFQDKLSLLIDLISEKRTTEN